jgi:hypothetical protein
VVRGGGDVGGGGIVGNARKAANEACVGTSNALVNPKLNARLRVCSKKACRPSGLRSYLGSNPFVAVVKYFNPSAVAKSMISLLASPGVAYAVAVDILAAGRLRRFDSVVSVMTQYLVTLVRRKADVPFNERLD